MRTYFETLTNMQRITNRIEREPISVPIMLMPSLSLVAGVSVISSAPAASVATAALLLLMMRVLQRRLDVSAVRLADSGSQGPAR